MDKSDQFSNWEKRPLRNSQINYAALDAYCLIEVYDVIKKCCDEIKFRFEEVCYHLMTNEKTAKKKQKRNNTNNKKVLFCIALNQIYSTDNNEIFRYKTVIY